MNKPQKIIFGATGWPPQAVEMLKKMRDERASLQKIADELGITRSMVSGKVRRLRLPELPAQPNLIKQKRKRGVTGPRPQSMPAIETKPTPPVMPPPCDPVPLLKLKSYQCRSVVAERDKDGLAMCCARQVTMKLNGAPSAWCLEHYRSYVDLYRMERSHG